MRRKIETLLVTVILANAINLGLDEWRGRAGNLD